MNHQVANLGRPARILCSLLCALLAAGCQPPGPTSLERGQELIAAKQWEPAILHLDEAIRSTPDSASAFELRGTARLELRQFADAAADFEQARQLAPSAFRRHIDLARAHLEQGNTVQAISACDDALRLNDRDVSALLWRAKALLSDGRASEALSDLERLLALEPASAQGWTLCGTARFRLGQDSLAERDLNRALEFDASHAAAYWARAQVRTRQGRPAEAEADRTRARQLNPALELTESGSGRDLLEGLQGSAGKRDSLDPSLK